MIKLKKIKLKKKNIFKNRIKIILLKIKIKNVSR